MNEVLTDGEDSPKTRYIRLVLPTNKYEDFKDKCDKNYLTMTGTLKQFIDLYIESKIDNNLHYQEGVTQDESERCEEERGKVSDTHAAV